MLTDKQVQSDCNIWGGSCQCRYLMTYTKNGHQCAKKSPRKRAEIDKKTNDFIANERSKGRDPWASYEALYDGGICQGFIILKHVPQGKQ